MLPLPFNGTNPNIVVILDNCSIHHTDEVIQAIQDTEALVHFLPPYSPNLNPIEEAFSKVKSLMKAMELEMQAFRDIDTIVYAAFSMMSVHKINVTETCPTYYIYTLPIETQESV